MLILFYLQWLSIRAIIINHMEFLSAVGGGEEDKNTERVSSELEQRDPEGSSITQLLK